MREREKGRVSNNWERVKEGKKSYGERGWKRKKERERDRLKKVREDN